ncbi:MAG: hypothetical protein ACI90V_006072, partial [Bacillariaceae sp.]
TVLYGWIRFEMIRLFRVYEILAYNVFPNISP